MPGELVPPGELVQPGDLVQPFDLRLRDPFGISRGSASTITVVHVRTAEGGLGVASPVRYHGETAESIQPALESALAAIPPGDRAEPERWTPRIADLPSSARMALDMAFHDARARRLGVPLHQALGLPHPGDRTSWFTIALDTDAVMAEKAERAASFPQLKIKLGRDDFDTDARTLRAVRAAAPGKRLMVDANAGWSLGTARRMAALCADLGVAILEQPLAIGDHEGLAALLPESPVPVWVDEDSQDLASLPALRGRVHGINIKLMKCGSLAAGIRMAEFARAEGWGVLLGCMIESGPGIAAAMHLASLADELDLDPEALASNNPATPAVLSPDGTLRLPPGPGLGVSIPLA